MHTLIYFCKPFSIFCKYCLLSNTESVSAVVFGKKRSRAQRRARKSSNILRTAPPAFAIKGGVGSRPRCREIRVIPRLIWRAAESTAGCVWRYENHTRSAMLPFKVSLYQLKKTLNLREGRNKMHFDVGPAGKSATV